MMFLQQQHQAQQNPPNPPNQAANQQNTGPVNQNVPTALGTSGGPGLPRWPLLAALLCIVVMLFGYIFSLLLPCGSPGDATPFCVIDHWPAFLSVLLIWLLFLISWIGFWCFGGSIQQPRAQRGAMSSFLRSLSDVSALQPLILTIGGLAPIWIILLFLFNRLQAVPFALSTILFLVAIWTRLYRPPRPAVQLSAQDQQTQALARVDHPLYRLRSLPLINRIWPNRP